MMMIYYIVVGAKLIPPLSELARFSYFLPSCHYFIQFVIRNTHKVNLHIAINATLADILDPISSSMYQLSAEKISGKSYVMPELPPLVKLKVN